MIIRYLAPVVLLLVLTSGAVAREPPPAVIAEGWSIGKMFKGLNNRTRVVQLCVVVMCGALFILMKKFDGTSPPEGSPPASRDR
jgi:hypothetical protein